MKLTLLISALLFSIQALGFTLSSQPPSKFSKNEVTVNVSLNDCTQSVTAAELLDLVEKAVDLHWNRVATCALELKRGSIVGPDLSGVDPNAFDFSIVDPGTILIGCNTNITGSTLGVGANSGTDRGAVLLNDGSTSFANLSETDKLATIAHEIGHAFGLGHSSDPVALMYYAVGGTIREKLTLDDFDGCTFLYPHDSPGSCSGVAPLSGGSDDKPSKKLGFFFVFLAGLLVSLGLGRFLKR